MRSIIVSLCLLLTPSAYAQTTYYYDGQGRPAGNSNQMGTTTYYYDGQGRPAGNSSQMGNTRYYYDAQGRPAGNSQRW